jgi:hypothetical protein
VPGLPQWTRDQQGTILKEVFAIQTIFVELNCFSGVNEVFNI